MSLPWAARGLKIPYVVRNDWQSRGKFSPAVPGLEWSQHQAWCETFQSWAFQQAEEQSLAPVTASCVTAVNWYRSQDRFSHYPAIGALAFFGPGEAVTSGWSTSTTLITRTRSKETPTPMVRPKAMVCT
ncbi:hypothetical protein JCM4914_01350 [Streptomyces platensis subsp. malvinus]